MEAVFWGIYGFLEILKEKMEITIWESGFRVVTSMQDALNPTSYRHSCDDLLS